MELRWSVRCSGYRHMVKPDVVGYLTIFGEILIVLSGLW